MARTKDMLTDPQVLLVYPGRTCNRSADSRHRGQWIPIELADLTPYIVRTGSAFLCKLCGLTMTVQIDVLALTAGEARDLAGWDYPQGGYDGN